MLNQQGNQLQLLQLNQQLEQAQFQYCKDHLCYFQQHCSFCRGQPETFHNAIQLDQKLNYIILEVDEKSDNLLFNAGISALDQEIYAERIAELTQQGTPPHQIAIELGLYSQEDLNKLIQEELSKLMVQDEEVEVTIDLWKISRTESYIDKAKAIANKLNLQNSIIFHPSQKVLVLETVDEQGQQQDNYIDQNVVTQILTSLKGERRNMTRKSKLKEFGAAQTKRLLNHLMNQIKQMNTHPFSSEIIFIANRNTDLEQLAKKLANQQTPLHIFCLENNLSNYFNIGGLTGGIVSRIETENIDSPLYKIRAVISKEYKFVESDSNLLEMDVSDFNEFSASIIENVPSEVDGVVQIIVYQHDGTCFVQQIVIDRNQLGEPNASNQSVSTLKLTEYSKQQ